jgi:hypothetical protein
MVVSRLVIVRPHKVGSALDGNLHGTGRCARARKGVGHGGAGGGRAQDAARLLMLR